ncbi:MAG: (Fe-S)-binding protein [Nitrospirae bacterium]|nr:(Fe-S)-binding protein [Nitrospirota bacterium]
MKKELYLKDLEKCVRCGSCKAYCPTYDEERTEAMGARGRLVLLRELALQRLKPTPVLNEKIFSCILCEACSGLCPAGVDIAEKIYNGRNILKDSDKKRRYLRLLLKLGIKNPDISFRLLQLLQHILFPYLAKKGFIPSMFRMPGHTFKKESRIYKPLRPRGRVAVFTGCSVNFLYPHLGVSLINVLLKSGYEVIVPAGEVCCGIPFRSLGLDDEAIRLAKRNMRVFGRLKVEAVLGLCPTCILSIKNQYPKQIGNGINNAVDVSSFLLEKFDIHQLSLNFNQPSVVTYHDPCHLSYGLGVRDEPRELLKRSGISIIEKKEQGCCGFGGIFSLTCSDISNKLLQRQAESFLKTDAKAVVTACPGCMVNLSKAITRMPVFHIVELIEEAYCGGNEV